MTTGGPTPSGSNTPNTSAQNQAGTPPAAQPPPPPAPVPQTAPQAHPKDQAITRRQITFGLIGIVVGAGIGAAGTWFTNQATLDAEKNRQLESYRRDKRIDIYSNVLKSVTEFFAATNMARVQLELLLKKYPEGQARSSYNWYRELSDIIDKFNDAYNKVATAVADSEIISSKRVIEVAHALRDKCWLLNKDDIDRAYGPPPPGYPDYKSNPPDFAAIGGYDKTLLNESPGELSKMYIERTKGDLDLND